MVTGEAFKSRASTDDEAWSLKRIRRAFIIKDVKAFVPFVASRDEKRKRGRDKDEDSETHVLIYV